MKSEKIFLSCVLICFISFLFLLLGNTLFLTYIGSFFIFVFICLWFYSMFIANSRTSAIYYNIVGICLISYIIPFASDKINSFYNEISFNEYVFLLEDNNKKCLSLIPNKNKIIQRELLDKYIPCISNSQKYLNCKKENSFNFGKDLEKEMTLSCLIEKNSKKYNELYRSEIKYYLRNI